MALDLPIIPLSQSQGEARVDAPADLTPALDRLSKAFDEGFIGQQDIQKRATVGTSDAEAQRAQNDAARAKAEQDRLDAEGAQQRPSVLGKILGQKPERVVEGAAPSPGGVEPGPDPLRDRAEQSGGDFSGFSTEELTQLLSKQGFRILQ